VVKRLAKSALRQVAAALGSKRLRKGPHLVVLTYHRVLPPDHAERRFEQPGMIVSPELLALHFDTLREHFTPIHLDDWLDQASSGGLEAARYAAVTFDDGWADNYAHGWPVLRAAGMPATVFVVTDYVGTMRRFWPNRLASVLSRWSPESAGALDAASHRRLRSLGVPVEARGSTLGRNDVDQVIERAKHADDTELHELCDAMERAAGVAPHERRDLLNWDELCEMENSGLVRVGSHTRRHVRMSASLDPGRMADEVGGSADMIAARLGRPPALFCYPNGDVTPAAARLVAARYRGALTTKRGWNKPDDDPYGLRRIGVHEDVAGNRTAFLARLAGWPGV
jgi:peptidoglycan/xylan/chitin deacetylase (PgdA/CDA1 family)